MAYPEGYPMIHPTLQDRDFELLNEGDPVFMDLDGGCKLFQREFRELSTCNAFGLGALVASLSARLLFFSRLWIGSRDVSDNGLV